MRDLRPRYRTAPPPKASDPLDGILIVDKPSGPTSHDVVDMIRRTFKIAKAGHGGTLDPLATGLLVILTGKGTKLSNQFLGSDKTYEGTMLLGIETDTQDAQGEVTKTADPGSVTIEQVEKALEKFRGDIYQTPPMVSAAKVDGVPLYKLARRGKEVERKQRLIHIYKYTVTDFRPPEVNFVVECTKGTYVRTLCSDLGTELGCGAHLKALRRTRSGDISIENAIPLDELLKMNTDQLIEKIIPAHHFSQKRHA